MLFAGLSLTYISYNYEHRLLERQIAASALYMYNQAHGISGYYSRSHYDIYSGDYDYNKSIKTFMLPDDTTLWIVSHEGEVIHSSKRSDIGKKIGGLPNYFGSNFYTSTDFNGLTDSEVLSVYSPIVNTYKTYGYVVMNQKLSTAKEAAAPISNYMYETFLIILSFSLIILIVFHFFVYRPAKKIKHAVSEYAKGNFDYEVPKIHFKGEIYDIGEKLKYIAAEMRETDNTQKKFIANVSHDFRSPLTSIKGYIEAMLDGTIPLELHEKYLNILLIETERLNKLTGSLLLLNTWDLKGSKPELADFDLVPLTRNIAATFQGQCSVKKITLDMVFGNKSYMVLADQLKIQQVIYNLLDNAIKFSHNNSVININISDKNDKVFVSIKDSGIGIPRDNINKIWERFYKTDISRGKDKTGSGLGLAIVKEVITSHNENIDVISTEGAGTEFIFTLQKSKK